MGKYIRRKCRGGGAGPAPAPAVVVAGVRTRSRSAAAPAPKRPRKARVAEVGVDKAGRREDGGGAAAEGCCYLQLRSRTLFMVVASVEAAALPREPHPVTVEEVEEREASPAAPVTGSSASVEALAGVSRCSSTGSSVDAEGLRKRNDCELEAREDRGEESSISNSGSSPEWREATPSSRAPGDLSDQESSMAADDNPKHDRRRSSATASATTSTVACMARMPPTTEQIEEFFAAAEKAEAERFAAKYNFDVVRGVPLDAGRFEWTPVAVGGQRLMT